MSRPKVSERDRAVSREVFFEHENGAEAMARTVAAYREEVTGELVKCLKEACENFNDMDQNGSGDETEDDPIAHWRAAISKAERGE